MLLVVVGLLVVIGILAIKVRRNTHKYTGRSTIQKHTYHVHQVIMQTHCAYICTAQWQFVSKQQYIKTNHLCVNMVNCSAVYY